MLIDFQHPRATMVASLLAAEARVPLDRILRLHVEDKRWPAHAAAIGRLADAPIHLLPAATIENLDDALMGNRSASWPAIQPTPLAGIPHALRRLTRLALNNSIPVVATVAKRGGQLPHRSHADVILNLTRQPGDRLMVQVLHDRNLPATRRNTGLRFHFRLCPRGGSGWAGPSLTCLDYSCLIIAPSVAPQQSLLAAVKGQSSVGKSLAGLLASISRSWLSWAVWPGHVDVADPDARAASLAQAEEYLPRCHGAR